MNVPTLPERIAALEANTGLKAVASSNPTVALIDLVQRGDRGHCRGCHARIYWHRHANGSRAPYDAEGDTVGVNHFVTCPERASFKRTGGPR